MTFTLNDAYQLAKNAHHGQTDKAGKPYIQHPLAVAKSLAEHGEQAQIAGMLHDVLEDTPVTAEQLLDAGVEPGTVEAIAAVTRREGEVYADFIRRAGTHPLGHLVKRADIAHNSDPERLAALEPKQAASLGRRYKQAIAILDGLRWTAVFMRYHHEGQEECEDLEQAIGSLFWGLHDNALAPMHILGPDGSMLLEGQALEDAFRKYEAEAREEGLL